MKKIAGMLSIFALILAAGFALSPGGSVISEGAATTLPDSLDKLYPPQAKAPVYLLEMFELSAPYAGILSDMFAADTGNVMSNFKKFRTKYAEILKQVPEWEEDYPLSAVDELGQALAKGDRDQIMAAYDKVGKTCHECHVKTMTPVQQKYHWMDFHEVKARDPLTQQEVIFPRFMQLIQVNLGGILVDIEQGQPENALKQAQGFKTRFQTFKESCEECHGDSERKYYVDATIFQLIDKLELALAGTPSDPQKARSLAMEIGTQSCHPCHMVHGPAALAGKM